MSLIESDLQKASDVMTSDEFRERVNNEQALAVPSADAVVLTEAPQADVAGHGEEGATTELSKERRSAMRAMLLPPSTPWDSVAWMNARYFVVLDGGKALVMAEEQDPDENRDVLKVYSFDEIRKFYQNRWVETIDKDNNPKSIPLGKYWLNHSDRRQYLGMVLSPKKTRTGYFNLWRGFSVEPQAGDWSLMDAHIRENICQGDSEVYAYVRKWLAFAVQNPDRLPQTALVMRGKQGTGKGVFARGFGTLFGQHFLHLARAKNLVGNFNAHLRDAIVVFADEAFLAGDKDSEGVLKALITEPEIQIEQKFKDLIKAKNLIHLIAASNNEKVISAAPEERRFCMLDVGEKHIQDHAYFAAVQKQLDEGGSAAMLHDLLSEDLRGFNILLIPKTGALRDQKLRSLSPALAWWFEKLQAGKLSGDGWPSVISRGDLVDECMRATRAQWTSQSLRVELEKVLPDGFPADAPRVVSNGERKRQWRFPTLTDCREQFDRVIGTDDAQWDGD